MKRWGKYIKPYLPYFILGPLCMIIEVIGEVVMPRLLAVIINGGTDGTLTTGKSIGIMFLMILTAVLMMAGGIGGAYFGTKAAVSFATDLRRDAYIKVQQYSFSNTDKFSTGSLVTRLTNDITQVQNFINMLLRMALRSPGMMVAAVIMAISLSPSLSIVLAVTIPLMLLSIGSIVLCGFRRFSKMQTKIDTLNSTVQENITNVRVVKSFVCEDYETEKFGEANRSLKNSALSAMNVMIFMQPVLTIFMNFTTLIVVWLGSDIVLDYGMKPGDLSAFVVYVSQIMFSLMMITMLLMFSSRAIASGKRVCEVLDEEIDISDIYAKYPEKKVCDGKIEFKDVVFRYFKGSEGEVLSKINLTIEPGSTVGIIGSTGCGKTTLISLIPRLYDVDEGEVLVDGINVRDYSLKNLRDGVGIVLQKNTLFSGSIAENLRWGDENATDEEMIAAAKNAQADLFVSTFKNGYETLLDKGGNNVSGGQKQRLCIARALLKKPKIIILDDSTSAVDTATEAMIRKAFKNELHGSTKIIIAQRIGSVKDSDFIVVMNEGCITGIGTHGELLESNTEYREIYVSQTSGASESTGGVN